MDYKYIEQLLDRYWACETSQEEEAILRAFFSQKEVPARLERYRALFQYEKQAAEVTPSDDFAERLQTLRRLDPERKVAVEVGDVDEGVRAADLGADILQCDKMSPEDVGSLVARAKASHPGLIVSAAGGVNAGNAADYARAGADFLVTSWPYFGRPHDVKMRMSASCDALP